MKKKQISNKKPIVILGAGGHSRVLYDCLELLKRNVLDVCEDDHDILKNYKPQKVELVMGIGSVRDTDLRRAIYLKFKNKGYDFATVIHPLASIGSKVQMGEGVQVMAGAIIQIGSRVGDNVLINTNSVLDHDCEIGDHSHVAPGATISGGVKIGAESHIGTGASIIQGIRLGSRCLVGAGSAVVKNFPDGSILLGCPAKNCKKSQVG
ncbi:MAG: acetyltransferase [Deltaproteobacteria bacterium]|nr:MAG: acetyltransferase [Deltaproteobacteria bacterium]